MRLALDTLQPNLLNLIIEDGRPLLSLTGFGLVLSGAFALFLVATQQLLPHDLAFLGMSAEQLHALQAGRVLRFMMHDRAAFGGVLITIGLLYVWLTAGPLKHNEQWAWQAFAISGGLGFASFFTFLGYGYLDVWHGVATLALLPCFLLGLWRTHPQSNAQHSPPKLSFGRVLLIGCAVGMVCGGGLIVVIGCTQVFVSQDLHFMNSTEAYLRAINPNLVPLIAHDRVGFGAGLVSCGVLLLFCLRHAQPSLSLWQTLVLVSLIGFGCAIGTHFATGYVDMVHLAPAIAGAMIYAVGLVVVRKHMLSSAAA